MGREYGATRIGVAETMAGIAVRFRHVSCALVAVCALFLPGDPSVAATVGLVAWSAARLLRPRTGPRWETADLVVALIYVASSVTVTTDPLLIGSAPQTKIAACSIISGALARPVAASALGAGAVLLVTVLSFRAAPAATVLTTFTVAYLPVVWLLTVGIRAVVLTVAAQEDDAGAALAAARLRRDIAAAKRRYQREQWAVLHDTAAATLMLVGAGTPLDRGRLAAQAASDVEALEAGVPLTRPATTDLARALDEPIRRTRTPVVRHGPASVPVPGEIGWAVAAAAREALANVDRHAGASRVRVELAPGRVVLVDDGRGPSARPDGDRTRHGIGMSIVGRLRAVGGDAEIGPAAGGGTRVELTWPDAAPVASGPDPLDRVERVRIRLAVGLAAMAVGNAVLQTVIGRIEAGPGAPWPVDLAGTLVTVAVATTAVLVPLSRRRAAALMAAMIAAALAYCAILPDSLVFTVVNWPISTVGWVLVVIGLRQPGGLTVGALVLWWAAIGVSVAAVRPGALPLYGLYTAPILFAEILVGVLATVVAGAVRAIGERDRGRRAAEGAARIERVLETDCRRRYRERLRTTLPLLRGLADGTHAPDDPAVRRAARAEHDRLRRLFARFDCLDHPLFEQLSAHIDDAEERGVAVTVEAGGDLPRLAPGQVAAATEAVGVVLAAVRTAARLVAADEDGALVVSVVGDVEPAVAERLADRWHRTEPAAALAITGSHTHGAFWLEVAARPPVHPR
ncbi:ATP-binding protein [Nocardia thailandica]|uniref:ATP-binding protein n=1 Tax=Nocardia thailandica TaxID=257275 RepID=A0ABW6PN60_9NOCA